MLVGASTHIPTQRGVAHTPRQWGACAHTTHWVSNTTNAYELLPNTTANTHTAAAGSWHTHYWSSLRATHPCWSRGTADTFFLLLFLVSISARQLVTCSTVMLASVVVPCFLENLAFWYLLTLLASSTCSRKPCTCC